MAEHLSPSAVRRDRAETERINQPEREEALVRRGEHPVEHERPEQWGWHGHMGTWGRWLIWLPIALMIAYNFGNHFDHIADAWLGGITALMIAWFFWDWRRRKNAWRAE